MEIVWESPKGLASSVRPGRSSMVSASTTPDYGDACTLDRPQLPADHALKRDCQARQ